jgi:hypothetical protein
MMEEEYRIIEDYPNYSVSNFGNVMNNGTGRILKPQKYNGYYGVNLGSNKIVRLIHFLVCEAFIGKRDVGMQVDHIDLNKTNNHLSNLRWATRSQNQQHKNKSENCLSRFKGVTFDKCKNRWRSQCRIDGRPKFIGSFKTEIEAAEAYNDFIKENNLTFCIPNIL